MAEQVSFVEPCFALDQRIAFRFANRPWVPSPSFTDPKGLLLIRRPIGYRRQDVYRRPALRRSSPHRPPTTCWSVATFRGKREGTRDDHSFGQRRKPFLKEPSWAEHPRYFTHSHQAADSYSFARVEKASCRSSWSPVSSCSSRNFA